MGAYQRLSLQVSFRQLTMEQQMVTIPLAECERMIRYLTEAEHYCTHAQSVWDHEVPTDPTYTFPGASGYAGATMRDIIQTLESHLV